MPVYVSLLRGINVGGNKRIKMADLRKLYQELGFHNPQTLLASGNAIFSTDIRDHDKITESIEKAIGNTYDFDVPIILRTASDWERIIENNPFAGRDDVAGNRLIVLCLNNPPQADTFETFMNEHDTGEEIHLVGNELYIHYGDGMGKSKLVIDSKLDITSTGRNWNTVEKIAALLETFEDV